MLNELTLQKDTIVFGNDNVVIRKCLADIQGGRTLDCSGIGLDALLAGHVVIKLANGEYAPMPVTPAAEAKPATYKATADASKQDGKTYYAKNGESYVEHAGAWVEGTTYYEVDTPAAEAVMGAYSELPAGASYAGVLKASLLAKNPAAAIMVAGVVNPEAVPYPMDGIMSAFKAAIPTIIFEKDEEA